MKYPGNQPSFCIGIGAAKAGTTWLADYLAAHPDTSMSPIKELHYFDAVYRSDFSGFWDKKWAETLALLMQTYQTDPSHQLLVKIRCVAPRLEMIESPEVYRKYFDLIVGESTKVFGEVTPAYALLPEQGYQAILDMYPDAKFIFMARDPVDRFLSQVQFTKNTSSGHPHSSDITDLGEKALSCIDNPHFFLRSDYKATLTTLFRVVRKKKMYWSYSMRICFRLNPTPGKPIVYVIFWGWIPLRRPHRIASTLARNLTLSHTLFPGLGRNFLQPVSTCWRNMAMRCPVAGE